MEIINDDYYILTEEEKLRMIEKAKGRSLAEVNPELAAQWNYEKNGDLSPEMVTANSGLRVWWLLPYDDPNTGKHFDFEWEAKVKDRAKSSGCPFLSGHRVWSGFNDLATLYPELVKEWHPTKNGNLLPQNVSSYSNMKVWWLLPYDDPITGKHFNFEWVAVINSRTSRKDGCPFLSESNAKVWPGFNDLASRNSFVASEWHPTLNGDLKPCDVIVNSNKKVWWLHKEINAQTGIVEEYVWDAIIAERNRGKNCPYLSYSKGEKAISEILSRNNILFNAEHKIKTKLSKRYLRFDFFLPHLNIAIEYDGQQHFDKSKQFYKKTTFDKHIVRDNDKTSYCEENNVVLLRIPYIYDPIKQKSIIEQIILDFIQTKQVPQEIIDFYSQFPFSDYSKLLQKQNS